MLNSSYDRGQAARGLCNEFKISSYFLFLNSLVSNSLLLPIYYLGLEALLNRDPMLVLVEDSHYSRELHMYNIMHVYIGSLSLV